MDESGTKHPDHRPKLPAHGHDWFAQGGVMIDEENISEAKSILNDFRSRWPQLLDNPLHSYEIRGRHKNFAWLKPDNAIRSRFLSDLGHVLLSLPVTGIACVIDRPGYNTRYGKLYGEERWSLCKTAFAITVERAAKFSIERNRKLRVYVERCSKLDDQRLKAYYDTLKNTGHWFNPQTAAAYNPIEQEIYLDTLYDFKVKHKTSALMQVADMFLWPMCISGYDRSNRTYRELIEAGKLIDCYISDTATRGIKYSCFELVV